MITNLIEYEEIREIIRPYLLQRLYYVDRSPIILSIEILYRISLIDIIFLGNKEILASLFSYSENHSK